MTIQNTDLEQLADELKKQIHHAQKSERWTLYRLIFPVIDYACNASNLVAYMEYNQTSSHGTSQSVDVALLKNHEPVLMVEAKRVGRKLSSGNVSKYIDPALPGIVTNGVDWILCRNETCTHVSLFRNPDKHLDTDALNQILQFIDQDFSDAHHWQTEKITVKAWIKPAPPKKLTTAKKTQSSKQALSHPSDLTQFSLENTLVTKLEKILLAAIAEAFTFHDNLPTSLSIEVTPKRISFFDYSTVNGSKRICRIALGKIHPDILIANRLLNEKNDLNEIAAFYEHDKNARMLCYRLSDEEQASLFGKKLANLLSL